MSNDDQPTPGDVPSTPAAATFPVRPCPRCDQKFQPRYRTDPWCRDCARRHFRSYQRDRRFRHKEGLPLISEELRAAAVERVEVIRRDLEIRGYPKLLEKSVASAGKVLDRAVRRIGKVSSAQDIETKLASGFTASEWSELESEALEVSHGKPESASTVKEFSWIRAKLYEHPDFKKAPSQGAIKTWLAISRPGNEQLLRDFVKLDWNKRLSPGERTGRVRDPLEKDPAVDDGKPSAEHDAELEGRLFGGGS